MPKKTENTKRAAGNAKKAEVAAQKQAAADAVAARAEDAEWAKGAKSNAKQEAAARKAAAAAQRKAEKDAQLALEDAAAPTKPKGAGTKTAPKKLSVGRALDLTQLDAAAPAPQTKAPALNATGIDDALMALELTSAGPAGGAAGVDKHPERRFKAAYTVFEARRLEEMKEEKGLRRQQKIELIRKEFERSPENPFNGELVGRYDMSKGDMRGLREEVLRKGEERLTSSGGGGGD